MATVVVVAVAVVAGRMPAPRYHHVVDVATLLARRRNEVTTSVSTFK
jgi:hypothetical protein